MARKKIQLAKTLDELMATYFPKLTKEQKSKEREQDESLTKKAKQEKASIKLRAKKATNSLSLYLDQYKDGKRTYEMLKDFPLNVEYSEQDRLNNVANLEGAKKILQERKDELLCNGIGIKKRCRNGKMNFIQYISLLADEELKRTNNKYSYYYVLQALIKHLSIYKGDQITFDDVDLSYCKGFLKYLKNDAVNFNYKRNDDEEKNADVHLTSSHQHQLFAKFNWVLNKAVNNEDKQGNPKPLIPFNPCNSIPKTDKPKEQKGTREFLDVNEIKALYKTECSHPQTKQAFLFCCLVGLRFSDVKQLKWKHFVKDFDGNVRLVKVMQKLSHINNEKVKTLDTYVSDEALKWLPERGNASDDDLVFGLLSDDEQTNKWLKEWVANAGITKKVTFHCSRHTAGTLNLSLGIPLAKVSKMLGHSKIETTEIYAKVLRESLKGEASKQNGIFD